MQHPRIGARNLCSHPRLREVSLGEEGWGCVPFLLLSPEPPRVPRCKWGIERGLTSGMSQSLKKLQVVVIEPVLAQSHHLFRAPRQCQTSFTEEECQARLHYGYFKNKDDTAI